MRVLRIFLTIIWAIALFVFTCSVNFHLLIKYHYVQFMFNPNPDWSEMFRMDFDWADNEWVLRKIGHFVGFFILAVLASNFGKYKAAFFCSVLYAAITEILQLFFFRGGRLYDIVNDSAGILLAYILCRIFFGKSSRHTRPLRKSTRTH